MRTPYLYGQLLCAAIAGYNVVVAAFGALRITRDRARELYFAGGLLCLTIGSYCLFQITSGGSERIWFQLNGFMMYLVPLCALHAVEHTGSGGTLVTGSGDDRLPRVILALFTGLAFAGGLVDLFTDWPIAARGVGDLYFVGLGPVQGARYPLESALAHSGFDLVISLWAARRANVLAARGRPELRHVAVWIFTMGPLVTWDLAAMIGVLHVPPPAGFLSGIIGVALAWIRVEGQNVMATAEQKRHELGGYRLAERIGAGGMAEVFVGERKGAAGFVKRVAIKRVLPHLAAEPHFVNMFLDEAKLAARLEHPNIVHVEELAQDGEAYFMVMELLTGHSLDHVLRPAGHGGDAELLAGVVPAAIAASIAADVLAGLGYAHRFCDEGGAPLGIVHRDISPQNIFLCDSGQVKVLDFGIARAADRSTRTATGLLKGKLAYMAPEQATGGAVDGRSDIFATGVVLHEMLTGRRPSPKLGTIPALERELALAAHGLPQPLTVIVSRALDADPAHRFADAEEMARALTEYQSLTGSERPDLAGWLREQRILRANAAPADVATQEVSATADTVASATIPGRRKTGA